VTTPTVQPS